LDPGGHGRFERRLRIVGSKHHHVGRVYCVVRFNRTSTTENSKVGLDGVTPAAAAARAGISDRVAHRLFDRLVALGAAREVTGREAFRIYGL
jgi:hypothetical protein